ncbi:hypothetical protein L3X38_017736 [Prunus dulcis]|uniref:Uncharacterized protein n=1 Tax=Prunus dulcis TaxID=3755 RepID=A0AAD4W7N5_PRUDU|nr:hypothetical protein L3X38_017736 [Prunus dulcis]
MTGASSSSNPSQVLPPPVVVSPKNGEEAAGVIRTSPPSISLLRPSIPTSESWDSDSGHLRSVFGVGPRTRVAPNRVLYLGWEFGAVVLRFSGGYPACRQTPYVALVVLAYGEILLYDVEVSHGIGYPALRQTPYVSLVVPAYGEIM